METDLRKRKGGGDPSDNDVKVTPPIPNVSIYFRMILIYYL